ncbi:hypothetical protein BJ944DRAFT_242373 [Cunninghamella echinulata]|nr:hypothetical protein BJ944DRAFT_242373 [Cunninghamella echinulata]
MILSDLPPELILEVYKWLFDSISVTELQNDVHGQRDWVLNILTVCIISRSWYNVGTYYISKRLSFTHYESLHYLLQTIETPSYYQKNNITNGAASQQQPNWISLLSSSQQNQLDFHLHVRKMVLNLSLLFNQVSLTTSIRRKKPVAKKGRNPLLEDSLLKTITSLFETCPNINKVEIIYDTKSSPRIEKKDDESISLFRELSKTITTALTKHAKHYHYLSNRKLSSSPTTKTTKDHCIYLNHLILKSNEQTQKCPCCIGKGWDHFLSPILKALPITILELDQVLPSRTVLEHLADYQQHDLSSPIHTLIIRGNVLIQLSRLARHGATISSPPRIPIHLFHHIKTLEIYLQKDNYNNNSDDDDQDYSMNLMVTFRQIYDMIYPMSSLKKLIIHGNANSSSLSPSSPSPCFNLSKSTNPIDMDIWSKLQSISDKCQLNTFILEDLPGFQCKQVQSRLHDIFFGVENLSIIYTN